MFDSMLLVNVSLHFCIKMIMEAAWIASIYILSGSSIFFFFCDVGAGLYLHSVTESKLVVDTSRGETLRINVMLIILSNRHQMSLSLIFHNWYLGPGVAIVVIPYSCPLKLTSAFYSSM